MQNYILYSDVDQEIVDKMANQAPDVNKRLRAINSELDTLQVEYDLFDTVRSVDISVKTDGLTAYDISTLVADNDVKSIKDLAYASPDNALSPRFVYLDKPEFIRRADRSAMENYYTLYTENGIQYLRVITYNASDTAETLTLTYHTTFKALDADDDFIEKVVNDVDVKILLPSRFKELVSLGSVLRLYYPAIGEDAMNYRNILNKEYNDKKVALGLVAAKPTAKVSNKFNLRPQI